MPWKAIQTTKRRGLDKNGQRHGRIAVGQNRSTSKSQSHRTILDVSRFPGHVKFSNVRRIIRYLAVHPLYYCRLGRIKKWSRHGLPHHPGRTSQPNTEYGVNR